jgi:hypothetical protein
MNFPPISRWLNDNNVSLGDNIAFVNHIELNSSVARHYDYFNNSMNKSLKHNLCLQHLLYSPLFISLRFNLKQIPADNEILLI